MRTQIYAQNPIGDIRDIATRMLAEAKESRKRQVTIFNEVLVVALPTDSLEDIFKNYWEDQENIDDPSYDARTNAKLRAMNAGLMRAIF